ncbi:MAG: 2-amino-4-hydroxy-6-hydroxymethyldihydropteridine diphosphokinase [Burkholderiales bacterium]|nr:2-amino-4-hydroxy-6-hydroxymethyldihydropteridine diphosphokinase [Burkholderiales bacterium]
MDYQNTALEICDILCHSLIGCNAEERDNRQDLDISLKLELGRVSTNDDLLKTVDYWEVCTVVKEFVEQTKYYLLEMLSEQIANLLLERYSLVKVVHVSICKLSLNNQKSRYIKCHYHKKRSYQIALALGSNMNNPRQQLISAVEMLSEFVYDIKTAPIYKSSPFGFSEQDDFYNTCISGYTTLEPEELLIQIKKLEKLQGKQEVFTNGPRIIDIDIILFASMIFQKNWFNIPHKSMHERDFVLLPLNDIEPEWLHPIFGKSVNQLLIQLDSNNKYIIE